jgi:PAS domain S-box-containing protein
LIFFTSILLVDCVVLHLLRRSRSLAANREKDLKELTANSPDILTRFDRQYRHLFVSSAIERIAGRPSAEFIAKTNRELGMPIDLCEQWEAALESVFITGHSTSLRFHFAGSVYDANLVAEFDSRQGKVITVLGVTRDVTDIDRHERKLREQDAQKDQMLATVAHELRNPLATFAAGIALLERQPDQSPVLTRAIAAMQRQTTQMSRLVKDLMDLNRIRANVVDLDLSKSDLKDILTSAVESIAEPAKGKSVAIECELLNEEMMIQADAGRLIQVFSNLLMNAIKFSKQGGIVVIQTKFEGTTYVVNVADNGAGIESHMLGVIFEPFVQAPAGHSQQSGLGIGLSLVDRIVRLHKGRVTATSQGLGKGSTFTVEIPVNGF